MSENKESTKKWTRRNLAALWDGQPFSIPQERIANLAECDRIMIALYRFQTVGKLAYRRLLGMHGGGGGTSDETFRKLLSQKVDLDLKSQHHMGKFPDSGFWPEPVPNAPPPKLISAENENRCFAYRFCWHQQPEFLLWHRALTAEFERSLQEHDPKYGPGDKCRHAGSDALAAPYWAWEGWDGLSLPQIISDPVYVIKTDEWKDAGHPKGSIIPNPYHRWFAPVSIEDQVAEYFPTTLSNGNTTTRASAFTDYGTEFSPGFNWEQVSIPNKPSMKDVVNYAIQNPDWNKFCTVHDCIGGGNLSIENAHNKLHNHVGGCTKGGIQGPGVQKALKKAKITSKDPENYTGTMTSNQSIFDPIFWLHHSNVERQLMSWQIRYASEGKDPLPCSIPPNDQMERVLYPWTKPNLLFECNKYSWNTPSSPETDGTFRDWWAHTTLPYDYDEYLAPGSKFPVGPDGIIPILPDDNNGVEPFRLRVHFALEDFTVGEYTLCFTSKSSNKMQLVGVLSVLSGVGTVCGKCAQKKDGIVAFEVSTTFDSRDEAKSAFDKGELSLLRNEDVIEITAVDAVDW